MVFTEPVAPTDVIVADLNGFDSIDVTINDDEIPFAEPDNSADVFIFDVNEFDASEFAFTDEVLVLNVDTAASTDSLTIDVDPFDWIDEMGDTYDDEIGLDDIGRASTPDEMAAQLDELIPDTAPTMETLAWDELAPEEQAHWSRLGWNSETWYGRIPLSLESTPWEDLSEEGRLAAQSAGFDVQSWNDQVFSRPTENLGSPAAKKSQKMMEALNAGSTASSIMGALLKTIPDAVFKQFQDELNAALKDDPALVAGLLATDRAGLGGFLNRNAERIAAIGKGAALGGAISGAILNVSKAMLNLEQDKYSEAAINLLDAGLNGLKILPESWLKRIEAKVGRGADASTAFLKNVVTLTQELSREKTADNPLNPGLVTREIIGLIHNGYLSLPEAQRAHLIERLTGMGSKLEGIEGAAKHVVGLLSALPETFKLWDEWDTGKRWVNISNLAQKLGPKAVGALVYASTKNQSAADAAEFFAQLGADHLANMGKEARESWIAVANEAMLGNRLFGEQLDMMKKLAGDLGLNWEQRLAFQNLTTALGGQHTTDEAMLLQRAGDLNGILAALEVLRRLEVESGQAAVGVKHFNDSFNVAGNDDSSLLNRFIDYFSGADDEQSLEWRAARINDAKHTVEVIESMLPDYDPDSAPSRVLRAYQADLLQFVSTFGDAADPQWVSDFQAAAATTREEAVSMWSTVDSLSDESHEWLQNESDLMQAWSDDMDPAFDSEPLTVDQFSIGTGWQIAGPQIPEWLNREGDRLLDEWMSMSDSESPSQPTPPTATAQSASNSWITVSPANHELPEWVTRDVQENLQQWFQEQDSEFLTDEFSEPDISEEPFEEPVDELLDDEGYADPLVLDLNGNGQYDLTTAANGHNFDITGTGQVVRSATTSNGDGLLALDRNGNGRIDNGTELFGDQNGSRDGFSELARYDDNGDGRINALDRIFSELRVFQDIDRDGETDDGELRKLSDFGIVEFRLEIQSANEVINGSRIIAESTFVREDGSEGRVGDALFHFLNQK